jgi:hypothetical protein
MTKKQFTKKLKEINKDIKNYLEKEALRLFESGGIDTSSYENNYLLPKICLYVALKNTIYQYRPLSDYIKEANNLENF